jgi:predicted nuclease with TOPRIM domain
MGLLDVTERAHRAERQGDLMRMELMATRNCLTEQADSLFEKQAAVKQKEEILEESRRQQAEWEQERAKLEAENEARLAAFEQEKAELVERLKTSESRVSWLEQRVPRWVRSLFRAG